MIAARERADLAEDHLDCVEPGRAFIHQPSARERGAPAPVRRLGVTEIDGVILRKAAVERDVEQAALARREYFGTPASAGESAPSLATMRMRPGRSVTSMRPAGRKAIAQG